MQNHLVVDLPDMLRYSAKLFEFVAVLSIFYVEKMETPRGRYTTWGGVPNSNCNMNVYAGDGVFLRMLSVTLKRLSLGRVYACLHALNHHPFLAAVNKLPI